MSTSRPRPTRLRDVESGFAADDREVGGRLLVLFGRLLAVLLAGYLLFDRAFAYLHLPGTPVFVGEMVLAVGILGVCTATVYLRTPLRDEPVMALLAVFVAWGAIRAAPGLAVHGMDALRDSALWYYGVFAFLVLAAIARSPDLPERLVTQLGRLTPWLLVWLPVTVVLSPLAEDAPTIPFTTVSVLSHKPGSVAIAALLALASMWLLPGQRSARSRAVWSVVALLAVALLATQNRGGLLAVAAGALVGLVFVHQRAQLAARAVAVMTLGLALAVLLPLKVPLDGLQGRDFSAEQLVANVASLGGQETPGNLGGTVDGRQELWTRILDRQVDEGRLVDGSGFGQNLAAAVGIYDDGEESLRNPHNSHLNILARMGLVGLVLWVALWAAWYRRLVSGCRRLATRGSHVRRQIAVLCLAVATATLVASTFDPQLEGPQVAVLLWTVFGVGVAVTSTRAWYDP